MKISNKEKLILLEALYPIVENEIKNFRPNTDFEKHKEKVDLLYKLRQQPVIIYINYLMSHIFGIIQIHIQCYTYNTLLQYK